MALALDAGISARHLSWLETGKSQPSRAMVLRLGTRLELPLRERNVLLLAAGYAPMYADREPSHPALGTALQAVQRLLDAHEPWPALAVDRHWNLVAANRMVQLLLRTVAPALLGPPLNVLRVTLHPQGLAPMIANLAEWRGHVLARLQRQCAASGDAVLAELLAELRALPRPAGAAADAEGSGDGNDDPSITVPADATRHGDEIAVPLRLETPHGPLAFIGAVTVFGAAHDVWLSELALETLLPADAATAEVLRRMHDEMD